MAILRVHQRRRLQRQCNPFGRHLALAIALGAPETARFTRAHVYPGRPHR